MCELKAIMVEDGNNRELMTEVIRLTADGSEIVITGMFGETLTVQGEIIQLDLTKQELLIRKIK